MRKRAIPPSAEASFEAASWVPQDSLQLWEGNPRENDVAVPKVANSIRRFGFVAPVVVWTSRNQLVAGHTRLKALRKILSAEPSFVPPCAPGAGLVPVRYHEFVNEAEAQAYAIADNRLNYEADWDYEKLAHVLHDIKDFDVQLLDGTGFDDGELDALLRSKWSPDFEGAATGNVFLTESGAGRAEQSSEQQARTLTFNALDWEVVKRAVQAHKECDDEPKALAAGLVDLCQELLS